MTAPVRRPVGILGGMGPEATVLLMQRVIAAVPAQDDADHVPLLVDQNPQVPSRIRHLIEGTGEDPGPVLAAMAARLQAAGAQAIAMPCNTAHHFAPAIRQAISVPFIDMVAEATAMAREMAGAGGRVGLLASPAVRRTQLFEPTFAKAELTPVYLADDDALLAVIRRVKADGPSRAARDGLAEASARLAGEGARIQMIACTEFSLIADAVAPEAEAFDTLDCLIRAIVGFAAPDVRVRSPRGEPT
ncbi:aspartate/glutamate racemase family protein [Aureimonas jatrophae]|uniref:Aspartate racemase n=1 Tax=Aureimonas jatrophae TaxID=1166073 RepID=A0A1H0FEC8_9HYPH|nr:amino acid racemase [Aureimonas jatrophae]MBB3950055.1 aspartate racemase [Aureimonas jatrophae]SDN93025.1 aspartate racemase [Aureimonas jatrophae]